MNSKLWMIVIDDDDVYDDTEIELVDDWEELYQYYVDNGLVEDGDTLDIY